MQWWQEQEAEELREQATSLNMGSTPSPNQGENENFMTQVRDVDLTEDRPFTIGVGWATPEYEVDTRQRNMVVEGRKARQVRRSRERQWDAAT